MVEPQEKAKSYRIGCGPFEHQALKSIQSPGSSSAETIGHDNFEALKSGVNTTEVWNSLIFGWVRLSESEIERYPIRKLCKMRRTRLLKSRKAEFEAAIEADFPDRVLYEWNSSNAFGNVDELLDYERSKAIATSSYFSDEDIRAKIARARFRAIYLDPTLLWIEGTRLEENDCEEGLYRLKYPAAVEDVLVRFSAEYRQLNFINALRMMVLHACICFDAEGNILGSPFDDFQLSISEVREIFKSIGYAQTCSRLPLGYNGDLVHLEINGERCRPICYLPKSQRKELLNDGSVLRKTFNDEESLRNALDECWKKYQNYWFGYGRNERLWNAVKNSMRALRELDGIDSCSKGASKEAFSLEAVALERAMEKKRKKQTAGLNGAPAMNVTPVDDLSTSEQSKKDHELAYENWCERQLFTIPEKVASAIKSFFKGALVSGIITAIVVPLYLSYFTNTDFQLFEAENYQVFIVIGAAVLFGLLWAVWDAIAWPAHLAWDKTIPKKLQWAFGLSTIGHSILAAIIGGAVIPFGLGLITALLKIQTFDSMESMRVVSIVSALVSFAVVLLLHAPKDWLRKRKRGSKNPEVVRSDWEKQIANHVCSSFPNLEVETNNRSIIKSRDKLFEHYEIDIWIPEIKLAIETNGEQFHDHNAYNRDKRNGTMYSREMYKEKFCEDRGITLIHVWSSESMTQIFNKIDVEIKKRSNRQ